MRKSFKEKKNQCERLDVEVVSIKIYLENKNHQLKIQISIDTLNNIKRRI